jgi:ligand-binding sensor domain-containing protein
MKKLILLAFAMITTSPLLLAQGTWTILNTGNSEIPSDDIISIGLGIDDEVFIGTPGGLVNPSRVYTYSGATWDELDWLSSFQQMEVSPLGHVAIASASGVYHYDEIDYTFYDSENSGLTANDITCIDVDADGNEYAGMTAAGLLFDGGLAIYDGSTWTSYTQSEAPLPADDVVSVLKDEDGPVYIGTVNGLVTKAGDTWTVYDTDNSEIPDNHPVLMATAPGQPIWIAFNNGSLATFDGQDFNTFTDPMPAGFPDAVISAMLFDNETLWVGFNDEGIGKFDGTTWTFYNTSNSELPHNDITGMVLDSEGKIWISTDGGGIGILEPQVNTSVGEISNAIKEIYPNPVESTLMLAFQEMPQGAQISIFNNAGQHIFSQQISASPQAIDVSTLPSGYYYIQLVDRQNGSVREIAPFVKK